MGISHDEMLDFFCKVLEIKERKRALYEDALHRSRDEVGQETFRFLCREEATHINELKKMYEDLKRGTSWADACRYVVDDREREDIEELFRRIAANAHDVDEEGSADLNALDTGIKLEDTCIRYFEERAEQAAERSHKEFFQRLAGDERQHRTALADLKFYYSDPHAWFMEKSGARLDGAGPVT